MKKIIALTAALLAAGIIGIHTTGAAADWHGGYMYDSTYNKNNFDTNHMIATNETENNRSVWGPGYCFTDEAQRRGLHHHITDYGYGPMHRNGYRR